MAVYAVGDIQGCAAALEEALAVVRFDAARDRLWLTGDLVNRGADSLRVLRLVKGLGKSAITVLGNHDLHLLAVAAGARRERAEDTLREILRAPDCDELLHWLRHQPLVHWDDGCGGKADDKKAEKFAHGKTMMVHAGVYPGWRRKEVARYAGEVEALLRGADYRRFLRHMYGRNPARWDAPMARWQRARFITNVFTRIRFCDRNGTLNFTHKGKPGTPPKRWMPWYMHPQMRLRKWRVVFGHWSALGFYRGEKVLSLDSGCAWGGALTVVRLDGGRDGMTWQFPCGG